MTPLPTPGIGSSEHCGIAGGGRAEPEALAAGDRLGAASCPLREPARTVKLPLATGHARLVSPPTARSRQHHIGRHRRSGRQKAFFNGLGGYRYQ